MCFSLFSKRLSSAEEKREKRKEKKKKDKEPWLTAMIPLMGVERSIQVINILKI